MPQKKANRAPDLVAFCDHFLLLNVITRHISATYKYTSHLKKKKIILYNHVKHQEGVRTVVRVCVWGGLVGACVSGCERDRMESEQYVSTTMNFALLSFRVYGVKFTWLVNNQKWCCTMVLLGNSVKTKSCQKEKLQKMYYVLNNKKKNLTKRLKATCSLLI